MTRKSLSNKIRAENYRDFEGELVFYIDEVMRNGKA